MSWNREEVARDLSAVVNRYSIDSATNTPDFILGEMLAAQLVAYELATARNAEWHGDSRTETPSD